MKLLYNLLLLCSISIFVSPHSNAQRLVESRRTSYYRFIYEITQQQAKQIHKEGINSIDESYFYNLVDSIPLDSAFVTPLPQGNYLSVWVENNELHYEFRSYSNIDLVLHNNYADLTFMLRNKTGNLITDATAKFENSKVNFDQKTQCYYLPHKYKKGLLEVDHDGFTTYFYIDNIAGKRSFTNKVLYSFPLKYITIPVKLVLYLPYDIYRSIKYNYLYGLPYFVAKPFKDIYWSIYNGNPQGFVDKLANRFDRTRRWNYGYALFSKPKYRPKDTVKVKAYISNKKGKPYNKPLNVYYHDGRTKLLGKAKHDNKGGYYFEFPIVDSLNFKLDRNIYISFGPQPWVSLTTASFKYEDYELKDIKYSFKCDGVNFYPGDSIQLTAKGEDMNGNIIPDGKVEITITSGNNYGDFKGRMVHVPDTIWTTKINLEPFDETKIIIPESIFQPINLDYQVEAVFTNASNERTVKTATFNYWWKQEEITFEKKSDSLVINYLNLNKPQHHKAYIECNDINGNVLKAYWTNLPYQLKISPNVNYYSVTCDSIQNEFHLKNYLPSLGFSLARNHQSINIQSLNDENVSFKYYIYKKNHEITRGSTTVLDTTFSVKNDDNYFLSVQYEWGGESFTQNYTIPLDKTLLNLEVEQASQIFPGEEIEVKLKAKDYKGKAVKNVDVTAMALTKKFNYIPPQLQSYAKPQKERTLRNNYINNNNVLFGVTAFDTLDYEVWKLRMELDSIEFFRFIYPGKEMYQTQLPTNNDLTQFAPFVFKKGELQQAHIIWIDNSIAYSSIVTNDQPYSFKCTNGYHTVSIRTRSYDITLDSVKFVSGVKNILSIDVENNDKAIINPMKNSYTSAEKDLLRMAFARFETSNKQVNYTRQLDDYKLINSSNRFGYNQFAIAGPFHRLSKLNYVANKTWSFDYEPGYAYSINGDVLKMISDNTLNTVTNYSLENNNNIPSFTNEYWTKAKIDSLIEYNKNQKVAREVFFNNPYYTSTGNTTLNLNYSIKERPEIALYTLVFSNDSTFARIYNNKYRTFHDLKEGLYRIMVVYSGNRCFEADSIQLVKGGTHYLHITEPDSLNSDIDFDYLTSLIANKRAMANDGPNPEESIKQAAINQFTPNTRYDNTISGYVYDSEGLPLPGATVMLKGTTNGTITNIDGYYTLNIPSDTPEIQVMFIGFVEQQIRVGIGNHQAIYLQEDLQALDEVVVIGYGTQKKYSLTGSVVTVQSALQGRVAGVSVTHSGAPGMSTQIRIRGISSLDKSKQPLYVIDGIPYEGDLAELRAEDIADMEILKEESASAIYGSKAMNGVVILTLKKNTVIPFTKVAIEKSLPLTLPTNNKGLRTNFKDEAFWQPALLTDKQGVASFKVTMPDDITSWDTHFLAMSTKGQRGSWSGQIKAFLPLSANLSVPRFATQGDSLNILGKTINYLPDSVQTKTTFKENGLTKIENSQWIDRLHLDTLALAVNQTDTINIEYSIETDGFKDGEKREIPVVPLGSVDNIGAFAALSSDTTITWSPNPDFASHLYIESNPLNILQQETEVLRQYSYLCNEQKASKLIGLLSDKKICEALNKPFKYEKDIKRLIKQINEDKNDAGLWGWWRYNETSYWISHHVLKALVLAQDAGYQIEINKQDMIRYLAPDLNMQQPLYARMELLGTLLEIDSVANYKSHAQDLIKQCHNFNDSLNAYQLRQKLGYKDDLKAMIDKHQTTLYGSIYWGRNGYWLFSNDIMQTLGMYQLLKASNKHQEMLPKIRQWFFEQRGVNGWINTYQSSNLLNELLPDLIEVSNPKQQNKIEISWKDSSHVVQQLPFSKTIASTSAITIKKEGTQTIFAGYHQKVFNPNPQPKSEYFDIKTRWLLNGEEVDELIAGKDYQMEVKIEVKHKSDYLMLQIPIPAGCSYSNKAAIGFNEAHREYHKEKVNIYFNSFATGTYTKTIDLVPRFSGKLNINPAKMEQMYFPVFYGRNELKSVYVNVEK